MNTSGTKHSGDPLTELESASGPAASQARGTEALDPLCCFALHPMWGRPAAVHLELSRPQGPARSTLRLGPPPHHFAWRLTEWWLRLACARAAEGLQW